MTFVLSTTRGDVEKYVPLFNLKRKTVMRGQEGSRYEHSCWTIEVQTLEELVEFSKKIEQELIISHSSIFDDLPEIEVYDDYRE